MDELLNQSRKCEACGGHGLLEINGEEKKDGCKECGGSGIIVDNRLADILKENLDLYIGKANRLKAMPKMLSDIYNLYNSKLQEAYDAGYKAKTEEKDEEAK